MTKQRSRFHQTHEQTEPRSSHRPARKTHDYNHPMSLSAPDGNHDDTQDGTQADARDRARRIKLIIFDVDGVLTDGQIIVVPDPGSITPTDPVGRGVEVKGFAAHDGLGMTLARLGGLQIGIITKRQSQTVAIRARDLKIDLLYQGQSHKLAAAIEMAARAGVGMDQVAYVGDDIVDLPVMRVCGFAVATSNARPQVLAAAHYITPHPGGAGAGRDAIDYILTAQGSLDRVIEEYLDPANEAAARADVGSGHM